VLSGVAALSASACRPGVKKVGRFWSARVGDRHRALAIEAADGLVWFWIGTHAEYDKLVG
jgi:hypothetical protein